MDFHIGKPIVVEDESFQMDEHDIGYFAKKISLGHLHLLFTKIADIIRDDFSLIRTLKCPQ
jgi:hypothetical protein